MKIVFANMKVHNMVNLDTVTPSFERVESFQIFTVQSFLPINHMTVFLIAFNISEAKSKK